MKKTIPFFILLLISSSAYAETTKNAETLDGQKLYKQQCSVCHGDDGNAKSWASANFNPPPRNFTDPEVTKFLTPERMFESIKNGRQGTAMPAWGRKYSDEQIRAIVKYIRATFMKVKTSQTEDKKKSHEITAAEPHKKDQSSFLGNPAMGKAIYEKNCSPCHGLKGGGDGPRAYFIFPRPRNFTDPLVISSLTPEIMNHSITNGLNGTVMPAWGGILTESEIKDVTAYIYSNFFKKKLR